MITGEPRPASSTLNFYLFTEDSQKTNGLETETIDVCDGPLPGS
jgi:hypothetical protein